MTDPKGWLVVNPVMDETVRQLCVQRYPGHPNGCPNFGKKPGCPPKAPLLSDTLDVARPVYAVFNVFDFGGHVERMRRKHPDWSERQLACCLYWQPTARKHLQGLLREFCRGHRALRIVGCPEAQGVNVTETMRRAGIELEWPPRTVTYQIALAGTPLTPEMEASK